MLKQLLLVVAVLQGCLMAFANSAFAESACPDWANPEAPIIERSYTYVHGRTGEPHGIGPRLDAIAHHWVMGAWFRLPFGYLNPWPDSDDGEILLDKQAYVGQLSKNSSITGFDQKTQGYDVDLVTNGGLRGDFAFWYPSLRYVERNMFFLSSSYRPCETGRERPTSNDFVVKFWLKWPFLPESGLSGPARPFRIEKERHSKERPLSSSNLKRREDSYYEPISGFNDYAIYHDSRDLAVDLSCHAFRGAEAPVRPQCRGDVWYKPSDLIFFITFPSDAGQLGQEAKWTGPVKAAIDLVQQWHAAAQADR